MRKKDLEENLDPVDRCNAQAWELSSDPLISDVF